MTVGTRTLDRTCGLFAVLLGLPVVPLSLWCAYWAWLAWNADDRWAAAWIGAVPLIWVGAMLVFARSYHRWRAAKGLG